MQTTVIQHPDKDKFVIIRSWHKVVCSPLGKTSDCAAAILAKFEFWHNSNIVKFEQGQSKDLRIKASQVYIRTQLLNLWSKNTIRKALGFLLLEEFIEMYPGRVRERSEYLYNVERVNDFARCIKLDIALPYIYCIKLDIATISNLTNGYIKLDPTAISNLIHCIDKGIEEGKEQKYKGVENESRHADFEEVKTDKKKAPPHSAAPPPKGKAWSKEWATLFDEVFQSLQGDNAIPYSFTGKDFKALSLIRNKLEKIYFGKNGKDAPKPSEEIMVNAFTWLMDKAKFDKWLLENYSLSNLNSQFNSIVALKTKKHKSEAPTGKDFDNYFNKKYKS